MSTENSSGATQPLGKKSESILTLFRWTSRKFGSHALRYLLLFAMLSLLVIADRILTNNFIDQQGARLKEQLKMQTPMVITAIDCGVAQTRKNSLALGYALMQKRATAEALTIASLACAEKASPLVATKLRDAIFTSNQNQAQEKK